MKKILTTLCVLAATTGVSSISYAGDEFSEAQIKQMDTVIENYIKNNPSVILDALENYRAEEAMRAEQSAKELAKKLATDLKADNDYPYTGNKDGDVVVAEFFDYNCGYCKKALDSVNQLIKDDKNVKVVFIELPILGEQSLTAARWAIASEEQGKYFEFHRILMEHKGSKSERELIRLAESLDLDIDKMKEDANSSKTDAVIESNKKLAQDMGVSGTPAFIIEDNVIRGYVPYDSMKEIIAEHRKINSGDKPE